MTRNNASTGFTTWRSGLFVADVLTVAGTIPAAAQVTLPPADGGPAWADVQRALGGRGTMQPGDVLRFGFTCTDLIVSVDGVTPQPTLGPGMWVAFKRMGASADTADVGDLVLTDGKVNPVNLALHQNRVEHTALHLHVMRESPYVLNLHIDAYGDVAAIALDKLA